MSNVGRGVRGLLGVVALFVSLMLVSNWWGDYRDSKAPPETSEQQSATPTDTADTPAEEPAVETTAPVAVEPDATQPTEAKTVVVLVDGLNFRVSPSRDAKLITGLDADTRLTWLGTEDGWHKVRDSEGTVGYVSSSGQYTRLEE